MSFLLDIIIALIIGLTIFFAVKNGLVKTAISAVSFIVAIIITVMFTSPLAATLKDTSIAESIQETTEQKIIELITESGYGVSELIDGASEEFNTMLNLAGLDSSELPDIIDDARAKTAKEIAEHVAPIYAESIAEPIVDLIATLVAVVILFFGAQIVLAIVARVLDLIAKLPILNSFNKAGGLIIGVVLAFIRVCLFCFIVNVLIENAAFLDSSFISSLDPEKTLLFNIFNNIDIFEFFIS